MQSNEPPRATRTNSTDEGDAQRSVPTAVRWIIAFIIILIIAFLILLLARWIYHKVSDKSEPAVKKPDQSALSDNSKTLEEGANKSPNTTATPDNNANKVPDSGPGNVIGVFAVSSLAAAGLHYIISVRRYNKTGV